MTVRVLLVDDQALFREALAMLLGVRDDIEVAGEAGDGATALALAAELSPDVVLLDLKLPGMDGIAVLTQLKAGDSKARVLVLTSATEPASASLALRSGAAGVVYKDVDPDAPSGGPGLGLGLQSMRERAAAAGGRLAIRSGPKGTTVRMTVPGKAAR